MNLKTDKILYDWICHLRQSIGICLVPRRGRRKTNYVEFIITATPINAITGRLNTLREAEECGFWVVARAQKGKRATYHNQQVFQLFLTPVHPKKRREAMLRTTAPEVDFVPIVTKKKVQKLPSRLRISKKSSTFAPPITNHQLPITNHSVPLLLSGHRNQALPLRGRERTLRQSAPIHGGRRDTHNGRQRNNLYRAYHESPSKAL